MSMGKLVVVVCMLGHVISGGRECIYTNSSKTQIINVQHQLWESQQCVVCLPQCRSCYSSADVSCGDGNCQSRYYYSSGSRTCMNCKNMCEQCTDGSTCQKCMDGYYLNSNRQCQQCMKGVSVCTSSSILQCKDGYYYDPQTYICRRCSDSNCMLCTGKGQCSQCNANYVLNSDGSGCLSCGVSNCIKCVNAGTCQTCAIGYRLQSDTYCMRQNCTGIDRCKQCTNTNNIITCTLCDTNYYLLDNSCHYGVSMMCEYSLTPTFVSQQLAATASSVNALVDYGSCSSCNGSIARQAQNTRTYCIPNRVGTDAGKIVEYNVYNQYSICTIPYILVSQPTSSNFTYSHALEAAYMFDITIVSIINTTTNILNNTNISNNLSMLFNVVTNVDSTVTYNSVEGYPLYCSNGISNGYIFKHALQFRILTDYPNNSSINQNTTIPNLSLAISLNTSVSSASESMLSIKQTYWQLYLCTTAHCLQCLSSTSCTKCQYPYYIQEFQCVLSCDIGYYLNPVLHTCTSQCASGYYGYDNLCMACPSPCVTCTNASYCLSCTNGYYLNVDSTCRSDCTNGSALTQYYPNSQYNECRRCHNPCKTCGTNASNCTSCLIGFQLYTSTWMGVCVFNCPQGYYQKVLILSNHTTNPQCLPCSPSCLQCDIQSNLCTQCASGQYLYNSNCTSSCPDGYYGSMQYGQFKQMGRCRACVYPCSRCVGTAGNCTQCKYGYLLGVYNNVSSMQVGTCVNVCPLQLYSTNISARSCVGCPINCKTCDSMLVCGSCASNYVLQNGRCVQACGNGWAINSKCVGCPYPCANCTGTSSTNYTCTGCTIPYYLTDNSTCVLVCPSQYYGNSTSNKCHRCPSTCSSCASASISYVHCLQCVDSNILFNYTCIPLSTGCPSSYYLSTTTTTTSSLSTSSSIKSQCVLCWSVCKQCAGSGKTCTKCNNNTYLLQIYSECVPSCPYGYINNVSTLTCTPCTSTCGSCSILATNCTSCKQTYYLYHNQTNHISVCLSSSECSAILGYYGNEQDHVCMACAYPCVACSSQTVCSQCAPSTYLYQSSCLSECPTAYHINTHSYTCQLCPNQCSSCLSLSVCLTCKPNYLYIPQSQSCVSECRQYQYPNYQSMECQPCKLPCLQCTHMNYCLSCAIAIVNSVQFTPILFNGQCLDHCHDGYYLVSNNSLHECKPCSIQCEICSSAYNCTACSHGYYLYGYECVNASDCPSLSYADVSSRKCSVCQPPCVQCVSRYECVSCVAGHLLKQGSCYISCPIGSYPNATNCIKCPSTCTRCSSLRDCQACTAGTYLFTNISSSSTQCVGVCPDGSYLSQTSKICQACAQTCGTCSIRPSNCTSCAPSRMLQDSQCVINCSKYYYYQQVHINNTSIKYCHRCNTSCSACVNYNVCLTCVSTYLVTPNTNAGISYNNASYNTSYCSSHCPPATFKNSQLFVCQPCQPGCLSCTSQITCLQCSATQGYVLYNIKCLSAPCQPHLYTIVDQNKCVDKSYCQANSQIYYIYAKMNQCYRKDANRCPAHLVYKNQNQVVDQCPTGYLADFNRKCIQTKQNADQYKFVVAPIRKNGHIDIIISFNTQMNKQWAYLFSNVTVTQGIKWKSLNTTNQVSQSRRLLTQNIQYQIQQSTSANINNALALSIVFTNPISQPTDLTFSINMNQPYTKLISINGKPLQNWQASTTLKSYMLTQEQLNGYKYKKQGIRALPVLMIIFAAAISILNLIKSDKIYLLIPTWDFMQLLYLMSYLPVFWPVNMRLFLDTFSVTWLRWFHFDNSSIVFSPEKVHSNTIDMHLMRNIICNVVLVGLSFLAYGICILIKTLMKLGKKQKQTNKEDINKDSNQTNQPKPQYRRLDNTLNIIKKIIIGISYLSISNIFYFALVNVFYRSPQFKNPITFWFVLSILILIAVPVLLLYAFYKQIQQKNIFDAGINPMKKRIIISLPLYYMLRKLFIILFLGVMSDDAAFPLCFGYVLTAFIFILVIWFQPYNNPYRYKLTLTNQAALFLFLILSFVYICNQRDMMQSGYPSFLIFLAVVVTIISYIYPVYHLYCLLAVKSYINKILKLSKQQAKTDENQKDVHSGVCIQQNVDNKLKLKNQQEQIPDKNSLQNQYQPPDSDTFSCAEVLNNISSQLDNNIKDNIEKMDKQNKQKKKKKLKLPKDSLIPGQTDHQADQSSQQGQKNKMRLADYTTRLTKRGPPAIKQFKNYDINQNQSDHDEQSLAQKQIQLSKLIQRQRTMVRNQTKLRQTQEQNNALEN